MAWEVIFHPAFEAEVLALPIDVQDEIADKVDRLIQQGPSLGRPYADTLRGSRYANMKELRLSLTRSAWRVAFAFDPRRRAVLLLAENKKGENERQFYRRLIREADARFDEHLSRLRG